MLRILGLMGERGALILFIRQWREYNSMTQMVIKRIFYDNENRPTGIT